MQRYVAFLRAINVGGRTVKMDRLRALFTSMGFGDVETFIASGNVIFNADGAAAALERAVEERLWAELGFEVATFLRPAAGLPAIAARNPFPAVPIDQPQALSIAFLKLEPESDAGAALLALRTETDEFHIEGREAYWLRRGRVSDSPYSGAVIEKVLRMPATVRNVTTVRRLADRYAAAP